MEEPREGMTDFHDEEVLRRIDRRNNIILGVVGISMAVISLLGILTE